MLLGDKGGREGGRWEQVYRGAGDSRSLVSGPACLLALAGTQSRH